MRRQVRCKCKNVNWLNTFLRPWGNLTWSRHLSASAALRLKHFPHSSLVSVNLLYMAEGFADIAHIDHRDQGF